MDEPRDPRKCTARSTTTGRLCRKWAIAGGTVCGTHGGRAPQVREAGRRRVVEAQARALAARLIDDPNAPPVGDPLEALMRLAGRLEAAADTVGALVNDLGSLVGRGPGGGQVVRAEITVWTVLLGERRQTLTALAKLDLDERLGKISAAQGEQVAAAFRDLVDALCTTVGGDAQTRQAAHVVAVEVLTGLRDGRYAA